MFRPPLVTQVCSFQPAPNQRLEVCVKPAPFGREPMPCFQQLGAQPRFGAFANRPAGRPISQVCEKSARFAPSSPIWNQQLTGTVSQTEGTGESQARFAKPDSALNSFILHKLPGSSPNSGGKERANRPRFAKLAISGAPGRQPVDPPRVPSPAKSRRKRLLLYVVEGKIV